MTANSRLSAQQNQQIRGIIFAHAIGDALGLGAEFLSKPDVSIRYDGPLTDMQQIIFTGFAALKKPGVWSDDTSQMLCILESLIARRRVDAKDVAVHLTRWLVRDGFGCGHLVYSVLSQTDYLRDPVAVAKRVWESTGCVSAPNGAVMRTCVLGIWEYDDLSRVAANAALICRVTHADPRCVASCVAVCVAIASLLQEPGAVDLAIERAADYAERESPGARASIDLPADTTLESLDLDLGCSPGEPNHIGYTYKALAAGFWALKHATTLEQGLLAVINEGGDADTNAAVAGGLLGARFGYDSIPERWIAALQDAKYLHSEVDDLLEALP